MAAKYAQNWAEQCLHETPGFFETGLALAVAYLGQNKPASAKSILDPPIKRFPTAPDAYIQRGIANFGLRNVLAARRDLNHAIGLDPNDTRATHILDAMKTRHSQ